MGLANHRFRKTRHFGAIAAILHNQLRKRAPCPRESFEVKTFRGATEPFQPDLPVRAGPPPPAPDLDPIYLT